MMHIFCENPDCKFHKSDFPTEILQEIEHEQTPLEMLTVGERDDPNKMINASMRIVEKEVYGVQLFAGSFVRNFIGYEGEPKRIVLCSDCGKVAKTISNWIYEGYFQQASDILGRAMHVDKENQRQRLKIRILCDELSFGHRIDFHWWFGIGFRRYKDDIKSWELRAGFVRITRFFNRRE